MKPRRFQQIDVFGARPYFGNPVAVVLDAEDLGDDEMQRFARWTNLSETTFVLPPTDSAADYRVRIFTPGGELPFAGHPTLGTCHAWLEARGGPAAGQHEIVQQCGIGQVRVRRDRTRLAFAAPASKIGQPAPESIAQVAHALGIEPQRIVDARLLDNGPVWLALLLDAPQTVLALRPDHARLASLGYKVGVAALYPRSGDARQPDLEVRAFAAAIGVPEDPVTGSLNASLAQWLTEDGRAPRGYVAAQGACLGRAGRVFIECDASGQVWTGGETASCIDGTVVL